MQQRVAASYNSVAQSNGTPRGGTWSASVAVVVGSNATARWNHRYKCQPSTFKTSRIAQRAAMLMFAALPACPWNHTRVAQWADRYDVVRGPRAGACLCAAECACAGYRAAREQALSLVGDQADTHTRGIVAPVFALSQLDQALEWAARVARELEHADAALAMCIHQQASVALSDSAGWIVTSTCEFTGLLYHQQEYYDY